MSELLMKAREDTNEACSCNSERNQEVNSK